MLRRPWPTSGMGMAIATGGFEPWSVLGLLTGASLLAYHGGMALNDAVDAEVDLADERGRPIAEGRVSRREAFLLAGSMLIASLVVALAASAWVGRGAPAVIAVALVSCVVAYNTRWKRTPAGPALMGACRALNGLLGMSVALSSGAALLVAPGTLLYVIGLTSFARDEASGGRRDRLAASVVIALVGVAWLATAPWVLPFGRWPQLPPLGWWTLWVSVILHVMSAFTVALLWPSSKASAASRRSRHRRDRGDRRGARPGLRGRLLRGGRVAYGAADKADGSSRAADLTPEEQG